MKHTDQPAPLVADNVDGRLLGKPPRSMLIRCMMADFGMTEAEAAEAVDVAIVDTGIGAEVDLEQ